MRTNGTSRMRNSPYQVSCSFFCVTLWAICLPSIPNTSILCFSFLLPSTPPLPPLLTPSAMNMDRFEKGPREILNPEIQKVSVTPLASASSWWNVAPRSVSYRVWSAASELYYILGLCHLYLECRTVWMIIVMSSFLRICWCWRNRR